MELCKIDRNDQMFSSIQLTDREFNRLSTFIENRFGIRMPSSKKSLLQGRLQKRLRALNIRDFKSYNDYLFSIDGRSEEIPNMINEVSTNKTDFFREKIHFDYLLQYGISNYLNSTNKNHLSIWSAACSSGEEPYTIAMTMNEFKSLTPGLEFKILATDISRKMISIAQEGIYSLAKTSEIPQDLKKKYFLRGKNQFTDKVKAKDFIKNDIIFKEFNLLSSDYHQVGKQDIIFCRNVLIYFNRDLQERVLRNICYQLKPGGYLLLGHTESIMGFSLPLMQVKPSIFIKTA